MALLNDAIVANDTGVVTAAGPPTISAEGSYWGCPAGPADPACDGVAGDVDADPFVATAPSCVGCTADSECDDGLFCTGSETCDAGSCVAGGGDPCVGGPACANLCDEGANGCIVPAGTVCRAAAGDCDLEETCTGLGGSCPADVLAPGSTTCRPSAGECDLAETCDGVGVACPADAKSTAVCRVSAGVCDVAESCTGSAAACPADSGLPDTDADTVCDAIDNSDAIANLDQANGDADALGDACDPCTNVVPTVSSKTKLVVSKVPLPATDDKLNFTGSLLDVPASPTVNPVANGLRILISDSTGAIPVDITLPGGTYDKASHVGWQVNRSGTTWRYRNSGRTVPLVNGITNAQLKAYASTPGKYKFTVRGKNGSYAVNTANLPLTGTLVIDVPFATTGQCGETTFLTPPAKPGCVVLGGGKNVRCR